ncbi:MAG: ABC transporter substrate-binding protein [Trueperaceae bacterium]
MKDTSSAVSPPLIERMPVRLALLALGLLLLMAQHARGDDLTVLVPSEFPSLSVCNTVSGDQNMLKYHIYSRLYTFDEQMQPQPDLVESESVSEDGTTWTLQLRPGVTFHDGTPLTAESVKFTIEHMRESNCEQRVLYEQIEDVRVDSETQITLVTSEVYPALRNNLAHPDAAILSQPAVESLGDEFGQRPVGSGPYSFVEWVTGDRIAVTRNADYYGGEPHFENINFLFIGDATTRALMIDSGQADVALRVLPSDVERLEANEELTVERVNGRNMIFPFNVTEPPFDQQAVRLAANYAVNKQAIIDRVLFGAGVPAQSLVETVQYATSVGFYEYDPERARELLDEAGAVGAQITMLSPVGRYPQDSEAAQAVAGYLREVGFDVDLQAISDWPSYVERVESGDFSLFMLGWGGSTGDPDNSFRRTLSTPFAGRLWNPGGYSNPEADRLLNEGANEFDTERRAEVYEEFQRIVWEDAPWLFTFRAAIFIVQQADIGGIKILPGTEIPIFWEATR